ncbi:MAG: hypothetical protein R2716_14225 [Microthrixaceae bacterium]
MMAVQTRVAVLSWLLLAASSSEIATVARRIAVMRLEKPAMRSPPPVCIWSATMSKSPVGLMLGSIMASRISRESRAEIFARQPRPDSSPSASSSSLCAVAGSGCGCWAAGAMSGPSGTSGSGGGGANAGDSPCRSGDELSEVSWLMLRGALGSTPCAGSAVTIGTVAGRLNFLRAG